MPPRALIIGLFALAACGQPPSPKASASIDPIAAGGPSSQAAPSPALPPDFLIGRWGDNGDCSHDIVFSADGAFSSYTGGKGQWTLDGDIITMSGDGGVFQLQIRPIDARTLQITNPDGSMATSQRC